MMPSSAQLIWQLQIMQAKRQCKLAFSKHMQSYIYIMYTVYPISFVFEWKLYTEVNYFAAWPCDCQKSTMEY